MKLKLPKNTARLPTRWGIFKIFTVPDGVRKMPQVVLVNEKKLASKKPPLVRVHSDCVTGDAFGSLRCDCGEQLHRALELIGKQGGVLIYLHQEGRGVGLMNKIKAYALQDKGFDTVNAQIKLHLPIDGRTYVAAADILKKLGLISIRLLTNNPDKVKDLMAHGIKVTERVALEITPNPYNREYLKTKRAKLGHLLDL